ncbi:hypothetical protein CC2G_009769 [Coprinopsis cinerea AmutBmut pab1-1]|nr:hypothetical protein CC2G_009769 [Coprinopsis cinerea AmutBmut pab1-1]
MPGHKRQRGLEDKPIDISKLMRFTSSLEALKGELLGIDETEAEMTELMKHVNELQGILKPSKSTKATFSTATQFELANL